MNSRSSPNSTGLTYKEYHTFMHIIVKLLKTCCQRGGKYVHFKAITVKLTDGFLTEMKKGRRQWNDILKGLILYLVKISSKYKGKNDVFRQAKTERIVTPAYTYTHTQGGVLQIKEN